MCIHDRPSTTIESHPCKNPEVPDRLPVISLFSGAGGLDIAVERCAEPALVQDGTPGPLHVALATDMDTTALETLAVNLGTVTVPGDILSLSTKDLLRAGGLSPGDASLVIGGPPCTPFSKSGFWLDYKREARDPNASLLDEFARVVEEARPEAFILENVQGLTYRTHAKQFAGLLQRMDRAGYRPGFKVLNAADYGVPQLRKRVFVVGRRDGKRLLLPEPTHSGWTEHSQRIDLTKQPYVTSGEVLKDLLPGEPEDGEVVEGQFADLAASVPAGHNYLWHSERGGSDTPVFKWRSRYWTFLLKLDPDRPATTVQAQPGPWVGPFHWENVIDQHGRERARRLRLPEIMRLMTFPNDFVLVADRRTFQRQLGNAVPVELGKVVVRAVMEQLGYLEPLSQPEIYQPELL
jgi:DNA (cytosine-5)-methyltransferase 1